MKTYSNEMPLTLLPLGDGNYHYNYNVTTEEVKEQLIENGAEPTTHTQYVYDTVFIAGEPTVFKIVSAVMKEANSDDSTLEEITRIKATEAINELNN